MNNKKPEYEKTLESELFGEKKSKVSFADSWFGLLLITFLIVIFGSFVGTLFSTGFKELGMISPKAIDMIITGSMYFAFIGNWIIILMFCWIFSTNRPVIKTLTKQLNGNRILFIIAGLVIGFALNGACVFMAYTNKNIELSFQDFNPLYLVLLLVLVLIQSAAEEFICRGFLYYRLQKTYNKPVVSIGVSSLLFGIIHLFNEGVTLLSFINIVVVGVLFSMMVYYFDSLWCAFAAHTAWNYMQNIIFGLPNSGQLNPYSIFKLNQDTDVDSFFYNTGFGVEGTFFADIILILACVLMFFIGRKFGKKEKCNIWDSENK